MQTQVWYVLYTRPRSEKKLAEALQKQGIEHYLPLLRTRKKWSDRFKWTEIPAFASYVFVRIHYETQALAVLKVPQALQFVISNGVAAEISDHDVEMLRLALSHYAESLTIRDTSALEAGETVRIQEGPFAGKEAVIARIQGKTMLLVAFPALNKSVQAEIPVEHLRRV